MKQATAIERQGGFEFGTTTMSAVTIRRYRPTDVDPLWSAIQESRATLSAWMAWLRPEYSRDDVEERVQGRDAAWAANQEWGFVIANTQGDVLGGCGIHRIDLLHNVGEIGYWVRSSVSGRGVATSAARQLCRWAFAETSLRRMELVVAVGNAPSHRVAQKLGAVREGTLRQRTFVNELPQDCVLYSVLKHEFEDVR